jgi:hypothetical protein
MRGGNPKAEGRSPKETRMPKEEGAWDSRRFVITLRAYSTGRFRPASRVLIRFGFRVSDFFRASAFGLRISAPGRGESA